MKVIKHVGLDVHAQTISVAVYDGRTVIDVGRFKHDLGKLKKVLRKLGRPEELRVVYEAGPTGYGLCRALREWGCDCVVIAPSLVPRAPGDRVKTDRRDARALARLSFGGLLTEVRVPDERQEALRDLVRAREATKEDQTRARQQLRTFLLRHDLKPGAKMTKWGQKHLQWIRTQRLEHPAAQLTLEECIAEVEHQSLRLKRLEEHLREIAAELPEELAALVRALQGLKGVGFLTAITIASEVGDMLRFERASKLMSYTGVVPSEYSSGDRCSRGAITKCGNAHLRRVVGEAAWSYSRGIATPGSSVLKRREGLSPEMVKILEGADHRLHARYRKLSGRGKEKNKVTIAVARELLGFIWSVGVQVREELDSKAA